MTKDEIINRAKSGAMPEGKVQYPELLLFFVLRDVYAGYRKGIIGAEKGEALKNEAVRQFDLQMEELASAKRILRNNASMWQRIEIAGNNYRQNRTLENADAFIEAVYECKIKQKES